MKIFLLETNIYFLLELKQVALPALPEAITGGAAALIGEVMYVAGGQTGMGLDTATKKIWRMDLSGEQPNWEALPAWPGPERAFNQMVAQHNGREVCLYLIGGRRQDPEVKGIAGIVPMSDVYEFSPSRQKSGKVEAWRKRAASPKMGQSWWRQSGARSDCASARLGRSRR